MDLATRGADEVTGSVCGYLESNTSVGVGALRSFDDSLDQHNLDSLQLIQLVIWIESQIGKPVDIEALFAGSVFSVNTISDYIRTQRAAH